MRRRLPLLIAAIALAAACNRTATHGDGGGSSLPEFGVTASVTVDLSAPVAEVDARFLSFAVDSSQVVGGLWWAPSGGSEQEPVAPFDFARPRLRRLAAELAPAFLRIGGTDADRIYYDMTGSEGVPAPAGYEYVLTRALWDGVNDFAATLGLDVFFTLNAGPGPRGSGRSWRPDNARTLIRYTVTQGYPVAVWELGNEINANALTHGVRWLLTGADYARDLETLKTLVAQENPGAPVAGPSSAFWPVAGERLHITEQMLRADPAAADIVTWHYYPSQSERCPTATRRASSTALLFPPYLDEFRAWAEDVLILRDDYAPGTPVWLGETGNAQCGGEPGVSDRYVAGLWWLDELGLAARSGQQVVVRQTLAGSDYGLLDDATLAPRPDYWNSVLWKRLMGTRALAVSRTGDNRVRAYAHCSPADGVTVLVLNLNQTGDATVAIAPFAGRAADRYVFTGDYPTSPEVRLNGAILRTQEDGALPPLRPDSGRPFGTLRLPPVSYAFVAFPDADAPACR